MARTTAFISVLLLLGGWCPATQGQVCQSPGPLGEGVRITDTPWSPGSILVWNGSGYGIAWDDDRNGARQWYFAILDVAGNKVTRDIPVTQGQGDSVRVHSLVWSGQEYALAWREASQGGVFFRRISANGTALSQPVEVTGLLTVGGVVMVWAGAHYALIVDNKFYTIDVEGATSEPVDIPGVSNNRLVWNGAGFGLAWNTSESEGEIHFTRLDSSGATITAVERVDTDPSTSFGPSLVWTGAEYGVTWHDNRLGEWDGYFRRLHSAGLPIGDEVLFTDDTLRSTWHSLTWNGAEYAVLWHENWVGGGERGSYFARLNPLGVKIGDDLEFPGQAKTQHVWNGSGYAAAFTTWLPDVTLTTDVLRTDFRQIGCNCIDYDGDTFSYCGGTDCDDTSSAVYPGAVQICDGVHNDCNAAGWPQVPADEIDGDQDGVRTCEGDCDDEDPLIHPTAPETCDGRDENCNGRIDEDVLGEDSDGDLIHNLCDNCVAQWNMDQSNVDGDALGDRCDNCPADFNPDQSDIDSDRVGDVCDNCVLNANTSQTNVDEDPDGNACDLDDGLTYFVAEETHRWTWQEEGDLGPFNVYRGDMSVLASAGAYSQAPGSNPLADRRCGIDVPEYVDETDPDPGRAAFYLIAGVTAGVESDFGRDAQGNLRPNENPCGVSRRGGGR